MCNRRKPNAGDELIMHCFAKGVPKPTVTWWLNGQQVESSKRVRQKSMATLKLLLQIKVKDSMLTIKSSAAEDNGKWECRASNYLGEIEHTFDVEVQVD